MPEFHFSESLYQIDVFEQIELFLHFAQIGALSKMADMMSPSLAVQFPSTALGLGELVRNVGPDWRAHFCSP